MTGLSFGADGLREWRLWLTPTPPLIPMPCSSWSPAAADALGFAGLAALPLSELVAPDWAEALAPVEGQLRDVLGFLAGEVAGGPRGAAVAVKRAAGLPPAAGGVRVLIVGQDPYPTPGHAVGLSFAVDGATRPIPRSLANIYKELEADLGFPPRIHGDLSRWADQGVLLLNRVLSVRAGAAGSHRNKGWEAVTAAAIRAVADRASADGGGHRSPRGDPVGEGRRVRPAAAGVRRRDRQRPPQPALGLARVLRLPALQPGQRPAAGPGQRHSGLGTAAACRSRPPAVRQLPRTQGFLA